MTRNNLSLCSWYEENGRLHFCAIASNAAFHLRVIRPNFNGVLGWFVF